MFGFKKKIDKKAWAAAVLQNAPDNAEVIPEEQLRMLTGNMIAQHHRIIKDIIRIVQTSKNPETREHRRMLCEEHYFEILKLEPFADAGQLMMIQECKKLMQAIE